MRLQKIVLLLVSLWISACEKNAAPYIQQPTLPAFVQQHGHLFDLSLDNITLEINAKVAARVSSLKIDNKELLLTANDIDTMIWGNVFWSSPQGDWTWPPIEALDSAPYKVSVINDAVVFTSATDTKTGYQFVKTYSVNRTKNAFSIKYTIYNRTSVEKSVAPWEVTRLPPHGTIFFPHGDTESFSGIFYPLTIVKENGISWFVYDPQKIREYHHKLFSDGKEGWVAYTDQNLLFVKEFADVPVELAVPGEAEIGLFTSSKKDYMEMAQEGAYTKLAPGEHLDWEVLWHVHKLPENIKSSTNHDDLVSYARSLVSKEIKQARN